MYPERPETLHLLPEDLLTPLAKLHIQETLKSGGAIVTLRRGKVYLSLAVMLFTGKSFVLKYLGTVPAHRNKGYATRLLRQLLEVTDRSKPISCSVDRQLEGATYMAKLLERLNFRKTDCYHSFWVDISSLSPDWPDRMADILARFQQRFERRGFHLISFRDASHDLLEQVRLSRTSEFKNSLDPKLLFDIPGHILHDRSYMMVKDGRMVAYSLSSSLGEGVIEADQTAAAEEYRGTGIAIVPLLAIFVPVIKDPQMHQIRYQIDISNLNSLRATNHVVEAKARHETLVDIFRYMG